MKRFVILAAAAMLVAGCANSQTGKPDANATLDIVRDVLDIATILNGGEADDPDVTAARIAVADNDVPAAREAVRRLKQRTIARAAASRPR